MSRNPASRKITGHPPYVLFAALGDATRLALVTRLSSDQPHSIAQLTEGTRLTRQAITKHLRVLERAGILRCTQSGREMLYEFQAQPILEMHQYLEQVSHQWDQALARLKRARGEVKPADSYWVTRDSAPRFPSRTRNVISP